MKKSVIVKMLIFLTVFILFSCAVSIPTPESSEDTLLVVLTEKKLQGGVNEIFSYFELMTDKSDIPIIVTPKKKFCMVNGLPEGKYLDLTILERDYTNYGVSRQGAGQAKPEPIEVPFLLKPGYITVFPLKFTYIIKITNNGYTYGWDIDAVSEEEMIEALTELKENDGFSSWKNDFGL